ncbi:MAG: radical SAM protein, partial [Campylobacteraceae bacterium]|nr:radical SAM protein [Campylobacteraceae bacterium]
MPYSNSLTFGPIPSRRFGISLGIDLSPATKQCNFDCLYCELEPAATVTTMDTYPEVHEVVAAVQEAFSKHEKIDVLTITANGEPTLYPHLDKLVDALDKIKGNAKTLILSNGANIYDKKIQKTLTKI